MLRQIFKSLIVARQASAAFETLSHLSDHQLQDIGFTRATYVDEIKAQVLVEMDDADEKKSHPNADKSKFGGGCLRASLRGSCRFCQSGAVLIY